MSVQDTPQHCGGEREHHDHSYSLKGYEHERCTTGLRDAERSHKQCPHKGKVKDSRMVCRVKLHGKIVPEETEPRNPHHPKAEISTQHRPSGNPSSLRTHDG